MKLSKLFLILPFILLVNNLSANDTIAPAKVEEILNFLASHPSCKTYKYKDNKIGFSEEMTPTKDNLNDLRILRCKRTYIEAIPYSICSLKNLVLLSFSENRIWSLPDCINSLTNLETINMSFNRLYSIPLTSGLINLKRIDLSHNNIEDITLLVNSLGDLKDISVDVSYNPLTEASKSLLKRKGLKWWNGELPPL